MVLMFNLKSVVSCTIFVVGNFIVSMLYLNNVCVNFLFYNWFFFDVFSLLLVFTTLTTLIICLYIVDNKYFYKNKLLFFIFIGFSVVVIGLVSSDNLISFFFFYELLLVPSFFLVRESSPNRRSTIVSNYFLLWTQLGSFLVLLGIFNIFITTKCFLFSNMFFFELSLITQLLIFIGFGIKIPLWPFHFWLSKTHVEANTGFSIFLSGILVKAAVYGIYKFSFLFSGSFLWVFLTFVFLSIIDASLKMCVQVDLKKLVAFSTIQEMGVMTFLLLTPTVSTNQILFVFVIFHTFISGLFFWIVDCLYRRLNTRLVYNINGLINILPKLAFAIIVSIYLFMGLPFTIKFSIELWVFKNLWYYNPWLSLIMSFFVSYISILFFFKTFLFINFGHIGHTKVADLSKKELLLFLIFTLSILLLNLL